MAGSWIKFDTSTSDKPEVWAIAMKLDIDPDAVVGKLLRIWTWFDDHSEKGNAPIVTRALLDRRVGVTGFVTAMIEAGWMQEEGEVLVLPNFDRHNGQTAKNRALTAKRVSEHKKSNAGGNAKGNATSVTGALPREEKRREEKNKENKLVDHPYLADSEFAELFSSFAIQSRSTHSWRPGSEILNVWLYELTRMPIDEAKKVLRFSTSAGAKKPILNGDHKPRSPTGRQRVDLTLGPDD